MRRLAFLAAVSLGLGLAAFNQPAADASDRRRPDFKSCDCFDLDRDGRKNKYGKKCITPEGDNKKQKFWCDKCADQESRKLGKRKTWEYVNTGPWSTKPNHCKR